MGSLLSTASHFERTAYSKVGHPNESSQHSTTSILRCFREGVRRLCLSTNPRRKRRGKGCLAVIEIESCPLKNPINPQVRALRGPTRLRIISENKSFDSLHRRMLLLGGFYDRVAMVTRATLDMGNVCCKSRIKSAGIH